MATSGHCVPSMLLSRDECLNKALSGGWKWNKTSLASAPYLIQGNFMMTFAKTPRKAETDTASWRRYYSRCKQYRVSRCISKVGLPDRWYAESGNGRQWKIISVHRKRVPAEKACQRFEKTCD